VTELSAEEFDEVMKWELFRATVSEELFDCVFLAVECYQDAPEEHPDRRVVRFRRKTGYSAVAWLTIRETSAVLAFRGSKTAADWLKNARFWSRPERRGGRVHCGFQAAIDTIWPDIEVALDELGDLPVSYTGHSLGGAMATIAAARRAPLRLVTIGAPRVGDAAFNRTIDREVWYRFVNNRDIVPRIRVPFERMLGLRYEHGGVFMFIDGEGDLHRFEREEDVPEDLWKRRDDPFNRRQYRSPTTQQPINFGRVGITMRDATGVEDATTEKSDG